MTSWRVVDITAREPLKSLNCPSHALFLRSRFVSLTAGIRSGDEIDYRYEQCRILVPERPRTDSTLRTCSNLKELGIAMRFQEDLRCGAGSQGMLDWKGTCNSARTLSSSLTFTALRLLRHVAPHMRGPEVKATTMRAWRAWRLRKRAVIRLPYPGTKRPFLG